METADVQQLSVNLRNIQPTPLPSLNDDASSLTSPQLGTAFEASDSSSFQSFQPSIAHIDQSHPLQNAVNSPINTSTFVRPPRPGEPVNNLFTPQQQQRLHHQQHHAAQQRRGQRLSNGGDLETRDQFAIALRSTGNSDLPNVVNSHVSQAHSIPPQLPSTTNALESENNGFDILRSSVQNLQHQVDLALHTELGGPAKSDGYFKGLRLVPDPPDLEAWREKLFNVDETITLSEEQFQTYFPHVDNVYSHRSTQKYKRKPFVSHYWDCRLKGRPPGTPKSEDPNKKKRKRTARQRDLCDVKIKITEYFPGFGMTASELTEIESEPSELPGINTFLHTGSIPRESQPFGVLTPNPTLPDGHPGANGERYFTIQRVNGNNGNGKNDGVCGGHRHTLEESDRVKKNSVQRYLLNEAKNKKKGTTQQKTYHTKATGLAAVTAKNRSKDADLKLYGSCFCPFVQRVWIALELKNVPYQYIEVDPYQKPPSLLEVNPRGLVPAIRHGDWGCYESTVIIEYLEDLNQNKPLLPGDAKLRAHCRLWADHINRNVVPSFYRVLQEQDQQAQISNAQELKNHFDQLVNAAHSQGPFFLGPFISFVDVQIAPWIIRLNRVLKPYRGWPDPDTGSRWAAWVDAIENNEHVKATTSGDELYLDSYERYAQNRPNTSQLANAINSGRGLP